MAVFLVAVGLTSCQATRSDPETIATSSVVLTSTQQLEARLAAELGRAARPAVGLDNTVDGWRFVCGKPEELTGGPFNYGSSRLADEAASGLVDDSFCALFETTSDGESLREFFVGTTDSPVIDWMERYGLQASLFSE